MLKILTLEVDQINGRALGAPYQPCVHSNLYFNTSRITTIPVAPK